MKAKTSRKAKGEAPSRAKKSRTSGAIVRVYRQGLGDCILVKIPDANGTVYSVLIDCGVAVATTDAEAKMSRVVDHIANDPDLSLASRKKEVGPKARIDVLAITHQHWDHVSGFTQAEEAFKQIEFGEIWLAWTEDPDDELANKLRKEHERAFALISGGADVKASFGDDFGAARLLDLAGLLGAAGEKTTAAMDKAKGKSKVVRYLLPTDQPRDLPGTGAKAYVLGPPHEESAIKNYNPSKKNPQTYELLLDGTGVLTVGMSEALGMTKPARPFSESVSIPQSVARSMPFFQRHYWGVPGDGLAWRRIETDWLSVTEDFALMLQNATNNTSLVLAIELTDQRILLFAGDAQVGNWLSWHDLEWKEEGRTVTGPDILARTVFYKVGHHGSHNATLKEKGLEAMSNLKTAVIPVDEVVAKKMRWGAMPLSRLVDELNKRTQGRTFRTDERGPVADGVRDEELFLEFSI